MKDLSANALNPDAAGISGLFSEGADWLSSGFDGFISTATDSIGKILGTVADIKLFDTRIDFAKEDLRAANQGFNPGAASGGTPYGGQNFSTSGNSRYLMIGGAVLLAVLLLPKLMKG